MVKYVFGLLTIIENWNYEIYKFARKNYEIQKILVLVIPILITITT